MYDFDNATGVISNFNNLPQGTFSVTFSPNSRYLYTIADNSILRYDVTAANVAGSVETLFPLDPSLTFGQMQVAPDGNIYFVETNFINPDTSYLSVVLCANSPTPCLRQNIHAYANKGVLKGFIGLSNFTDHIFRNDQLNRPVSVDVVADKSQICAGESVSLTAVALLGETYLWSNGETTPTITVNSPGVYGVTVSNGCCSTGTAFYSLIGGEDIFVNINGSRILCSPETPVELTATSIGTTAYLWSTGDTTATILADTVGVYSVTVTGACDNTAMDTFALIASPPITIETYQSNTLACEGRDTLRVITNGTNILWSTGDTRDHRCGYPGFLQCNGNQQL